MNANKHFKNNNIMQILSAGSRREFLLFCCRRVALSPPRTRQSQFQEEHHGFRLIPNTAKKLGCNQIETSMEKEAVLGRMWFILEGQSSFSIWRPRQCNILTDTKFMVSKMYWILFPIHSCHTFLVT